MRCPLARAKAVALAALLASCAGQTAGSGSSAATPSAADPVDAAVLATMRAAHIPGASVAVVKNGKVVKLQGYGLADVEQSVPATPQTIYQSGSMGKQFTAMAVVMLAEAHALSLDDPITKYLGDRNPQWRRVTIRHLLTHTGGISSAALDDADTTQDSTDTELLDAIAAQKLDFPPGTQWKYSNCGYELLGMIVKKASGQFYGDYLRDRVWRPLGMNATRIIDLRGIVPHRAPGYVWERGRLRNQPYVAQFWNTTADGAMYVDAEDMAAWAIALDARRLVSPASYGQIYAPVRLADGSTYPYGFGWSIDKDATGRIYDHEGVWQGFTGYITRHVDAGVDAVVLTNLGDSDDGDLDAAVVKIAEDLVKHYARSGR